MITEDYVSFEIAKLLKEKGFNAAPLSTKNYFKSNIYEIEGELVQIEENLSIPTQSLAMKWLREVHHVYMYAAHSGMEDKWFARVYDDVKHIKDLDYHKSYEEACEAAIKYCLENLI